VTSPALQFVSYSLSLLILLFLWNPKVQYRVHKTPLLYPPLSLTRARARTHTHTRIPSRNVTHIFSEISFNSSLYSHLLLHLPLMSPLEDLWPKMLSYLAFIHACYMSRPSFLYLTAITMLIKLYFIIAIHCFSKWLIAQKWRSRRTICISLRSVTLYVKLF
jgi:hypothetical protein